MTETPTHDLFDRASLGGLEATAPTGIPTRQAEEEGDMSKYFGMVVLFVRGYERCLEFYREALGMQLLRTHEGDGHPPWALLQLGELRLALHAGYEGDPLKGGSATPICVNFFVDDVHATIESIERHGGALKRLDEDADFRPTQPVLANFALFADPDGNEHFLVQETKTFAE